VEMAQQKGLAVVLLCLLIGVICDDKADSFKDAAQFVLDSFNDQPGSLYMYDSVKIINAYKNVSKVLQSCQIKTQTHV
jgi:hypothetical protein